MPVAIVDSFKNLRLMPDDVTIVADRTSDTLTLEGGLGVNLSYNLENDSIVIYNTGQGLAALDDVLDVGNTSNRSLKIGTLAINGASGLSVNWEGGSGGAVPLSTTIVTGGGGYVVNDVVTVVGGDENATFSVTTTSTGGIVTAITQVSPGTGYPVNSLVNQPTTTPLRAQLEADADNSLTLRTSGTGTVVIDSNRALRIPVGDEGQRPTGATGQIRFNSSTTQFEGYNGLAWTSLGGIRSVNGDTYIIPEVSPGSGDNTLQFIANNTVVATMNTAYAKFLSPGFVLPAGITDDRPVGIAGTIRFNTDTKQFEGYDGTAWISIGSVRDVDGNTYIVSETVPGANENTLFFYTNSFLAATLSTSAFTLNNDLVLANNQSVFFRESTGSGTNAVEIKAADTMPASYTLKLPTTIGADGNLLAVGPDGQLEFVLADSFAGGRITVSAYYGDDLNDGVSKPVKTIKRALEIASGIVYSPAFVYNEVACKRDVGLILDALGYDVAYGSNWQSVLSGYQYYSSASSVVIGSQKSETLKALLYLKNLAVATQTGGNITTVSNLSTVIYDIVDQGVSAAPAVSMPNPAGSSTGEQNAKRLILANIVNGFIDAEITAWIQDKITSNVWPGFTYNAATCARDVRYIAYAVAYDLIYGGNSQSRYVGLKYYDALLNAETLQIPAGQHAYTRDSLMKLKSVLISVAQALLVTPHMSGISQDTSGTGGTSTEATTITSLMDVVINILYTGPSAAPTLVQPTATKAQLAAQTSLTSSKDVIQYNVIAYASNYKPNGVKVSVDVAAGEYVEQNPLIVPDNVSVVGAGLRACNIRPANANIDFLRVRNASYFTEFTFRDHVDVDGKPDWTWDYAVAFDDPSDTLTDRLGYAIMPNTKPTIDVSPYIQNCSIISFLGGNGAMVDGRLVNTPNLPKFQIEAENPIDGPAPEQGKSMVANAFTMLTFGGTAWRVTNDAYIQIVSCFQIFALNGTYCQSGGYASITNSASNFGIYALRASGYSPNSFQFDKGYIAATGTANSKQTLTTLGFGRVPTQDYVTRFRDPAYRQAYDLIIANKQGIIDQTSTWILNQISGGIPPFVGYNYTGSNRTKGERDLGLVLDAVALDVLTGGNANSVLAGLSYQDTLTDLVDIAVASITHANGLTQTAITSTGLGSYADSKFEIVTAAIADPTSVPESVGYSNDGDITNTYKPATVSTAFNAATDVNATNNVITINSHGFNNGDAVIYSNNSNDDIAGIDNEQTYYVIYNDINSFKLSYDETLRLEVNILAAGTGTHLLIRDLQEFYIDELLESHNVYQELTLAAVPGNYSFTPGSVITGVTGVNTNNAYVHSYDPITRTLVVSLNKVTVGSSSIRNAFDDTSTIDADHSIVPKTNINVDVAIARNNLYSATFSIQSTSTGGLLTNLLTLPNKQIWLHRPSIVNSSGHTWEYAGSGTDYNALPQNGGQTRTEYEQYSDLPGRVYSSGTNELGDFKVGSFIIAENRTGNVSFTNKVSVNQLDALRLGIGGITIEQISADPDLGDNEPGGATDTRLSTQLAVRSFLANRLGNFIDKSVSTNAVPGAVIQLNASGQINSDLLPSVRSFTAAKAEGYNGRLVLLEEVPAQDFLDGDIVTETYSTVALTLSANVTAAIGATVTQATSGATGYLVSNVVASNVITVASTGLLFNASFDTTNNLTIAGDATPSDANGTVKPNLVGTVANNVNANYVLSNSNAGQYLILNSAGTYSFTNGNVITSANDQIQGTISSTRYGVIKTVNNASFTNGTGYTPLSGTATYKMVALTGGSGSGAYADITVTNGSVTSVDMRRGGINFNAGDPLSAAAGNIGGTVTIPFSIPVTVIDKRVYVTLLGGEKFTATNTSPNYIADNNAQTNNVTLTGSTSKSFNAADVGSGGNVDYATSRITITTHGFSSGDPVKYVSAPNVAIGALTNTNVYYVKYIDASTVELYSDYSLISKITFTSSSSGTHSITTYVCNIINNSFYIPAHPYTTGDALQLTGATLPTVGGTAIVSGAFFFAGSITTNSFTIHSSRSEALSSIGGLVTNAIDLGGTGSGTATFKRQNVSVFGVVNTSSTNSNNWSPLSTTNVDASNIISGVVNTSRLAGTGTANTTTYLRGDSTWHTAVQSLKETNSPLTLTGSYATVGLENLYYGDIALDIERVDSASGDLNYTNLGVAKFIKTQFQVGTGSGVGEVYIKDGVIDAGTLDSYDSSYFLNSANHSTQPVNKGGTNISTYAIGDITYASASAVLSKLPIGANNAVLTSTGSAPQWSSNLNLSGNLTVAGNLTVNGSTVTVNTSTISVNDKNIELGAVEQVTGLTATLATGNTSVSLTSTAGLIPGMTVTKTAGVGAFGAGAYIASIDSATQLSLNIQHAVSGAITFTVNGVTDLTASGGGITLLGATNKTITWDSTNSNWTSSEHWNLVSSKTFKIDNVEVLTSTKVLNRTPGGATAGDIVTIDANQTLTNKTLTTPVISAISNTGTLTLPTSTDTLVGRATTDTLSNKTLTLPKINDASSDNTYIFAVSELTANRTITLPLLTSNDTFVFAAHDQTLTNKTLTSPKISSISNTGTLTLPTSTDTLVGRATTDTLTNKTLVDSTTLFQDETTATKKMQFQLSGITANNTRVLTIPDVNGTIVTTSDTGSVTSTMIANNTIVDGDINPSAAIGVSKLAYSTISGVTLGNNLNTLTFGTHLTGTGYNGSADITIATDATNANTINTIVARDASGNFSAGTITATLSGTATQVSNTLTRGTYLTGSNYNGSAAVTWAVDADSANTASKVVVRDASGNFSAGTITATLSGGATSATTATYLNTAQSSTDKDDITTRTNSGFFQSSTATKAEGWPEDSNTWAHLISSTHSNGANYYAMQFAGSFYNSNSLYYRATNGSGTTAWNKVWHEGNDGSGSGLDADTVDGLNVHTGRNNSANQIVRTDANGYIQCGYINSSNGNEGNNSNPSRVWGTNGTDDYMRTYLTSALSVNYAASAGNADTVDNVHASSFLRHDAAGDWQLASSTTGSSGYSTATLELRESEFGGTSSYTPPRLSLHWGGVVASQIGIESSGRIAILNNPGTGYENLIAKTYYGTGLSTGDDTTTGSIQGYWSLVGQSRLQATYADLAEKYVSDAQYEPGTVVMFGGGYEITLATIGTRRVAGVVSTNAAYVMNNECAGEFVVEIALQGRVPCKVRGKVRKGDMLVADTAGYAVSSEEPSLGQVIGKALENFDGVEGVIEVVVGRL